jgi:hypothetical protein
MISRRLFASILIACMLTDFGGPAAGANAATAVPSFLRLGERANKNVIEIRHRPRGPRIYLPIAPSYLAYDYPYYYSRGYYPTHIGPGYIYYGYPYFYRRSTYLRYGGR